MAGVFVQERRWEAHKRRRHLEHVGMGAEILENHEPRTPRMISCHLSPGERQRRASPSESLKESNPADP